MRVRLRDEEMAVEERESCSSCRALMRDGFWEVVDVPKRNTLLEVGGCLAA